MDDERELVISIGNKFLIRVYSIEPLKTAIQKGYFYDYSEFILALVDSSENKINLINRNTGDPWTKPIVVKDYNSITDKEFFSLLGENKEFVRIRT